MNDLKRQGYLILGINIAAAARKCGLFITIDDAFGNYTKTAPPLTSGEVFNIFKSTFMLRWLAEDKYQVFKIFYTIVLANVNKYEWKVSAVKVVLYDYPGLKFDGKLYGYDGKMTSHCYNSILHGLLDTEIDGFQDYCFDQCGHAITRTKSKSRDNEKKFESTHLTILDNEVFRGSRGGNPFISTRIGFKSPDELLLPENLFKHYTLRALDFSKQCKYDNNTFLSKFSGIASSYAGGNNPFFKPDTDRPVTQKRGNDRFYHPNLDPNKCKKKKTKVNVSSFCV